MFLALQNSTKDAKFQFTSGFLDFDAIWSLLRGKARQNVLNGITTLFIDSSTRCRRTPLHMYRPRDGEVFPNITSLTARFYGALDLLIAAQNIGEIMPNLTHVKFDGSHLHSDVGWSFTKFPQKLISCTITGAKLSLTSRIIGRLPRTLEILRIEEAIWDYNDGKAKKWPPKLSDLALDLDDSECLDPAILNDLPSTLTRLKIRWKATNSTKRGRR